MLTAFARMVVDHVEDDLQPGIVNRIYHLPELLSRVTRQTGIRRKKLDAVIAPEVTQTFFRPGRLHRCIVCTGISSTEVMPSALRYSSTWPLLMPRNLPRSCFASDRDDAS